MTTTNLITATSANNSNAGTINSKEINYNNNGKLLFGKFANETGTEVMFCNGIQIGSPLWSELNDLDDEDYHRSNE